MGPRPAAETVVYRHECSCPNAAKPLPEDGEPVHVFDVDGEPFPWPITEAGVQFRQLHADMRGMGYLCSLTILPYDRELGCPLEFHHSGECAPPMLGGREFPWLLHGPATYTMNGWAHGLLKLEFFADRVDTDAEIRWWNDLRR